MKYKPFTLGIIAFSVSIFTGFAQNDSEQLILDTFEHEKEIVYKTVDGKDLSLVFFEPENVAPGETVPWMLYVHGGGWRGGNEYAILKQSFAQTLKQLTENGIACATVQYRLTRDHTTVYDSVVDCKDAARFLLKNADRFNLDPQRYGVWGGSAGGHLSLMTALGEDDDFAGEPALAGVQLDFKCVASYYPLTTLINPDVLVGSRFEDPTSLLHVLDGPFAEKPDLAKLLSPTEYLSPSSPPILLLHGDQDETLSINNSFYMMDVAQENEADVKLIIVQNAGHSFKGKNLSPTIEEVNTISANFILSHLTEE